MNIVYFLQRGDGCIKIGTTGDFFIRFQHLVRQHGKLQVIGAIAGTRQQEQATHSLFKDWRIKGSDWFRGCQELRQFASKNTSLDLSPYQARLDQAWCMKNGGKKITQHQRTLIAQTRRKPPTFATMDKLQAELDAAKLEIQRLQAQLEVEYGGDRSKDGGDA